MIFSVFGLALRMERVEGRLCGAERSDERLQADIDGVRKDVKASVLRLSVKAD